MLRLASPAPDLEDEAREWQTVLLGHLAALARARAGGGARGVAQPPAPTRRRTEGALVGVRGGDGPPARPGPGAERAPRGGDAADGGAHPRAGGDGPRRRAHGRHRARGAQRARHDRGLRAPDRARRGPAGRRPQARAILDECATLETVVRRFTDFVKLERLQLAATDLGPLASRVLAREQRGHDGVEARLVGFDAPLVVPADEELLERALENLVRNALEAAAAGGGHVELRARARPRAACGSTWRTTGPGFAADHPGRGPPVLHDPPGGPRPRTAARPQDRAAARGGARARAADRRREPA